MVGRLLIRHVRLVDDLRLHGVRRPLVLVKFDDLALGSSLWFGLPKFGFIASVARRGSAGAALVAAGAGGHR